MDNEMTTSKNMYKNMYFAL